MAKQTKLSYLWEFSDSVASNNCKSVADMEQRFANWLSNSNRRLITFGRDYMDNDMDSSVKYSAKLLNQNPALMDALGFSNKDLQEAYSKTYSGTTRDCLDSCGQTQQNQSLNKEHDKNDATNKQNDLDLFGFISDLLEHIPKWLWVILIAIGLISFLGDASFSFGSSFSNFFSGIYNFFAGGLTIILCYLIMGIISIKFLRANINCPLFVRIMILCACWIGILSYEW